ncbi:phospholipase DDHD1 isoform X3 [Petromyzon marinus]|uniref:phospholipase DDHD1 isoform X3 n=1 Tax=Petromyzon marinus TaxID=7757 RepID=UPI003F7119B2
MTRGVISSTMLTIARPCGVPLSLHSDPFISSHSHHYLLTNLLITSSQPPHYLLTASSSLPHTLLITPSHPPHHTLTPSSLPHTLLITPSSSLPPHHTLLITPSSSHPPHHTLLITPSSSHPPHHTLLITPSSSHPPHHTLLITPSSSHPPHNPQHHQSQYRHHHTPSSTSSASTSPTSISTYPPHTIIIIFDITNLNIITPFTPFPSHYHHQPHTHECIFNIGPCTWIFVYILGSPLETADIEGRDGERTPWWRRTLRTLWRRSSRRTWRTSRRRSWWRPWRTTLRRLLEQPHRRTMLEDVCMELDDGVHNTGSMDPMGTCDPSGLEDPGDHGEPLDGSSRRSRARTSSRLSADAVEELGPEEVRWFYRDERKAWKPFNGYDSLQVELAYRRYHASAGGGVGEDTEPVCVRGGLYEVSVASKECYPVYWQEVERVAVMRGQWFVDGTWQPLEEEDSDLIETEHLARFRGQPCHPAPLEAEQEQPPPPPRPENRDVIHSLQLNRSHVDWNGVDEVYLYSDATTSKIARSVGQKLGLSKASSSGTHLQRGYVEEALVEDRPPDVSHLVFVVHGIGQKMDQNRIIRNTNTIREAVRRMEERYYPVVAQTRRVEFLPVEWRSKLQLDGDTVDYITLDKVRGLRDMLNSSAMDILYYTSPLYRDELYERVLQRGDRENDGGDDGGGGVGGADGGGVGGGGGGMESPREWMSLEKRGLLDDLRKTRERLDQLEHRLVGASQRSALRLQFQVENFFCMGSPLAVFLALRGVRPGSSGSPHHILPKSVCRRLFNIFHPTDPVAYRLEPLILRHYSAIQPVQIHWSSAVSRPRYDSLRPVWMSADGGFGGGAGGTAAGPAWEPDSPVSPGGSPALPRRYYGESLTNLGKAGIMGAATLGKGLGGIILSRLSRSYGTGVTESEGDADTGEVSPTGESTSASHGEQHREPCELPTTPPPLPLLPLPLVPPPLPMELPIGMPDAERLMAQVPLMHGVGVRQMPSGLPNPAELEPMQATAQEGAGPPPPAVELEYRMDFELREGLVESRYWSAVTSHTSYWMSPDIALFLLAFLWSDVEPQQSS